MSLTFPASLRRRVRSGSGALCACGPPSCCSPSPLSSVSLFCRSTSLPPRPPILSAFSVFSASLFDFPFILHIFSFLTFDVTFSLFVHHSACRSSLPVSKSHLNRRKHTVLDLGPRPGILSPSLEHIPVIFLTFLSLISKRQYLIIGVTRQ